MKLKVLIDNNTYIDEYFLGEPAVCYYIEDENKKILLDTGYSDAFIKNAQKMDIDLSLIDSIVLSHGHDDHTLGLKYYFEQIKNNSVTVIGHPESLNYKVFDDLKICSPFSREELSKKCNLNLSKSPIKISKNITFLGEIPQTVPFEKRKIIGQTLNDKNELCDDLVLDDSALVYEAKDGLFIISGCSHSGICNICEYAKEVLNNERILGIIGGFHLFDLSNQTLETIKYFEKNNIEQLYPCHCTSFNVRAEMHKYIPLKEVGVGLEIVL